ncbi:MAG: hypothetical protein E2O59_03945, partial [Gammaproteobacteria bacterium]
MYFRKLSSASIFVLIGLFFYGHAMAYEPPSQVSIEDIVAASDEVMARADIPVRGDNGYVEDII